MTNEEKRTYAKERYQIRKELKAKGQFFANAGRPVNTPDVLWSKVDKKGPNECWPWNGYKNEQGYGRTWIDDKGYYAHRVIFNLAFPNVIQISAPKDTEETGFLLHKCDNPCCCNPSHLFVGTHGDNMADKAAKGRSPDFSGDNGPRCKLTMQQANEIRQRRKNGVSAKQLAVESGISLSSIKTLLAGKSYIQKE
jgi:HNH endonuclease